MDQFDQISKYVIINTSLLGICGGTLIAVIWSHFSMLRFRKDVLDELREFKDSINK